MKIKTDFVTNSSSTCYVLSSIVSGQLPRLSGGYHRLEDFYKDIKYKFLYEGYGHIVIENDKEYLDSGEPVYDIDLTLNDGFLYDENDDQTPVTFFELTLRYHNPYYDLKQEELVKEVIEKLLFKELKENIPYSQLMYFGFPSRVFGDGWDDGDPQGPSEYTYRFELYKAESKMGILNLINSTVIPEVRSIEQPLNLNEILLDNMNTEGFSLEEQNDKNS